jgi:sarcosine oxidase subunit gamma
MNVLSHDFTPGALAASAAASVSLLPPSARFSLRAREAQAPALSAALGLDLPARIGARSGGAELEALRLGPDEWLLVAPEAAAPRLAEACARVYAEAPHSLVDISDRELSVRIDGPRAADLLSLACPRDLDRLPAGEARRTVFDVATVILWRDAESVFRMDVWRSFAPHVFELLETGCAELAAE